MPGRSNSFLAATAGNVLGAVVNFALGRFLLRFERSPLVSRQPGEPAEGRGAVRRYGQPVLLFSWLPVIGDPLTLAAGLLRTPFAVFLVYVTIGKAARYAVLLWALECRRRLTLNENGGENPAADRTGMFSAIGRIADPVDAAIAQEPVGCRIVGAIPRQAPVHMRTP